MNQTFDLHRFGLMLKLDLAEKGKNNLGTAALLVGILLLLMLPIITSVNYSGIYEALHYIALFMILLLGSSLYTSSAFSSYASPSTGIAGLMTPASILEKFLSALLLNLLFIIPFLLLFVKLHFFTYEYANSKLPLTSYKYKPIPDEVILYMCYCYALIQGSIFLGSIYFTKASYIKSAAITIAMFLLAEIIQMIPTTSITGHFKAVTFPLTGWKLWYFGKDSKFYLINYPESFQVIVYIFPVLLLISLWFIAYLRLKEKEI